MPGLKYSYVGLLYVSLLIYCFRVEISAAKVTQIALISYAGILLILKYLLLHREIKRCGYGMLEVENPLLPSAQKVTFCRNLL